MRGLVLSGMSMRISVPWPGWLRSAIDPPIPFDDVLGDRQPEPGAGPLRGEVRVEHARHVLGLDAHAPVADDDGGVPSGAVHGFELDVRRVGGPPCGVPL